jgi:hypothetical protein
MKNLYLSIVFLLMSAPAFCQKADEKDAIAYVKQLITSGRHSFEVLEKDIPADLREILVRYRTNLGSNREWYVAYEKEHANEKPIPYHAKFGITEAEYARINNDIPTLKTKTKSIEALSVSHARDSIRFEGEGNFTIFDAVIFDLKNNDLHVDWQLIPYVGEITETLKTSLAGDWKGHQWKLEVGDLQKAIDTRGDYSFLELSFGKTTDGKTVLRFKAISVEEGAMIVNATVSGFLR